jgi:hypothetical protein
MLRVRSAQQESRRQQVQQRVRRQQIFNVQICPGPPEHQSDDPDDRQAHTPTIAADAVKMCTQMSSWRGWV